MSQTTKQPQQFAVSIDKKLTLGAIAAVGLALFSIGWNASTANGRIDTLERDIKPLQVIGAQINERTIRIEEQVKAIRLQLERGR